ncbi:hypothetical protein [Halobacillus hunanensis]|uniref:hypothetical protein n=1 Tax=Halobacillus hunanensis TaxID=578214 RepID=UPI0009A68F09|nr:hypothetical protein [Halobacillus hunanensis]
MNYVKEIQAFYEQVELKPISASAASLWHAMLYFHHKSGARKQFKVGAPVLCIKSGLGESTFKKARRELREKGYIIHIAGAPKEIPTYQMISLQKEENH